VVEPYPSEKYEFVSWDDDIPNWMESRNPFHGSSHHQPERNMGVWALTNIHYLSVHYHQTLTFSQISQDLAVNAGTFGCEI
jgi:hypothetical protein